MIASNHVGRSIESARQYLADHPDEARYTDTAASAVIEGAERHAPVSDSLRQIVPMTVEVGSAGE